ncbi:gamma-glutamyl-gamma-aminobutyrate hydrolase family protein [Thermostichus sp. MS-CIW-41]
MRSTRLHQVVGAEEISVVSWHHQAIRDVPSGWRLAARSRDELLSLRDANANAVAGRSPCGHERCLGTQIRSLG